MPTDLQAALAAVTQTRELLIEADVLSRTADVVRRHLPGRVMVVADERTWRAAGETVDRGLRAAGLDVADPLLLPGTPAADIRTVETVLHHLSRERAHAVVVGAGTLNDLGKRASHLLGQPYVVVATASSMDGYTAFAAPITVDGYKTSLPCPAPVALVADLDVLTAAPQEMTASGYGDLLGKITAGACWLVADAAGSEEVDWTIWPYLQEPFRRALDRPEELAAGEPAAFRRLLEGLVLSGLTIQMYESSRPGSGMEHLMSHLWEMQGVGTDQDPPLSHGAKVGLGTVAAAALYQEVLREDLGSLDVDALLATWPTEAEVAARVRKVGLPEQIVPGAIEQSLAKHVTGDGARLRLTRIRNAWPTLREALAEQLLSPEEAQHRLRALGGPAHPHDIGLTLEDLRRSYHQAQVIRSRYTVLDLAVDTGVLDRALDRLFAPDGFWGAQANGVAPLAVAHH